METVLIESKKTVREGCFDLAPIKELMELYFHPSDIAKALRDIHYEFTNILLEEFEEAELLNFQKEVHCTNETRDNLFYLKLLADKFDEIGKKVKNA
jgi:hypothetical protein